MDLLTSRNLLTASTRGARRVWTALPSRRAFVLLWIPAFFAATAVLLPILYLFIRVFSGGASAWTVVLRPETINILGRTLWLGFWVTLLSVALSLPLAWLTVRTDLPLRKLWAVLTPLPLVVPSYVGAFLFASALGPRGLIQGWLEEAFGITRLPSIFGFPGTLLVLTLLSYPYVLFSLRAAMQHLDPSQEEASRSLGYGAWQTFWRVTFPQLRPAMMAGSLLVLLYVLRDFGAVSVMRYDTFTRVIYIQYQSSLDRSSAAALAIVVVLLSLIVLALEGRTRLRDKYSSNPRSIKPPVLIALGKWRWPALIFCSVVIFLALFLPAGVLLYWLLRGLNASQAIGELWQASQNSVIASALAAGFALLAALPVTILAVRKPGPASRWIERATYFAFALPGIVIALALVFFGANFAPFIYQTLPMLVFAYVVLFLPQAVGAVRSSLLQVHPSMEEAARGLGQKPLNVFRRITLPLLRPGVVTALSLVFLTAMKELPATLLLAPIGFKTLATSVWSSVSEAFFAQAAAPALLLILASSLPMAILVLREEKGR